MAPDQTPTIAVPDNEYGGRQAASIKHRTSHGPNLAKNIAISLIAVLSFFVYVTVSIRRYLDFTAGVDLAIYGQAVQGYAFFRAPHLPLKSQLPFHALGDHFTPVVALIGPLYRVVPDIRTLVAVQAALLAVAVLLVGKFAVRRTAWLGVGIQILFALSWGVLQAVEYDFHEVAFAVPLLVLAVWAAMEQRWAWLGVWGVGLLLTKEDCAFLLAGIAICIFAQRQVRAAVLLGLASIASLLVVVYGIIPHFSFYGSYTYESSLADGMGGAMKSLADNLISATGLKLLMLFLATCGIGLRSPLVLIALPTLVLRFLSPNDSYLRLGHHYNATLMVICFMALVEGCRWLPEAPLKRWPKASFALFQGVLLVGLTYFSVTFNDIAVKAFRSDADCLRCAAFEEAISQVPGGAYIVADTYATAHLVDRNKVGLAVASWEDSTGRPLDPEWVLLDENSSAESNRATEWVKDRVDRLEDSGYREAYRQGAIVLLQRETS